MNGKLDLESRLTVGDRFRNVGNGVKQGVLYFLISSLVMGGAASCKTPEYIEPVVETVIETPVETEPVVETMVETEEELSLYEQLSKNFSKGFADKFTSLDSKLIDANSLNTI